MTNENIKYNPINIPNTATVSFYDAETGQNLTLSEWQALNNNTNEVRVVNQGEVYRSWKANSNYPSYGPYPDIWNESDSAYTFDSGFEAFSVGTKGRIEAGANERVYASAGSEISSLRYRDDIGDLKIGNYSASAQIGVGEKGASAGYKLGVDVASVKVGGTKVNVGVDVGSEASIGEGSAKVKVGGVGISIGKEIGISTPVGGVSINLEETCNQQ